MLDTPAAVRMASTSALVSTSEFRLSSVAVLQLHPLSVQCVSQLVDRAAIVHVAVAPGTLHAAHKNTVAAVRAI